MQAVPSRTVLVVDDEPLFRMTVCEALSAHDPSLIVVPAANGRIALEALGNSRVALVITDLKMPEIDGYELLRQMINRGFKPPVIVMTAFGTPEIERVVRGHGALGYLEKPVNLHELVQLADEFLRSSSNAHVTGLTVAGFLQLVEIERKTCSVRITSGDHNGFFYFERGRLIGAANGALEGDEAAMTILSWPEGVIDLQPGARGVRPSTRSSLGSLLLDSARVADELARGGRPLTERPANDSLVFALVGGDVLESGSIPPPARIPTLPTNGAIEMATINKSLEDVMKIDGAIGAALADWQTGLSLGSTGGMGRIDIEVAVAANCQVVRAKMNAMETLGIKGGIDDILITLTEQYHILRPLKRFPNMYLYFAVDRARGNLGLARHKIAAIEAELTM